MNHNFCGCANVLVSFFFPFICIVAAHAGPHMPEKKTPSDLKMPVNISKDGGGAQSHLHF